MVRISSYPSCSANGEPAGRRRSTTSTSRRRRRCRTTMILTLTEMSRGTGGYGSSDEDDKSPEATVRKFIKALESRTVKKKQEKEERNYVYPEERFNFPKDPENWREEDLRELMAPSNPPSPAGTPAGRTRRTGISSRRRSRPQVFSGDTRQPPRYIHSKVSDRGAGSD